MSRKGLTQVLLGQREEYPNFWGSSSDRGEKRLDYRTLPSQERICAARRLAARLDVKTREKFEIFNNSFAKSA
jgi:hypothetical protein